MSDAKIEIKVGSLTFSGEGSDGWLSQQLDKVLDRVPALLAVAPPEATNATNSGEGTAGSGTRATGTLAAFLKAKSATSTAPRKFLATAVWLHDSEQKKRLSTTDISAALSQHNQGRLANASDCLIKNTAKGFCVREGKQFYVTEEGRDDLK